MTSASLLFPSTTDHKPSTKGDTSNPYRPMTDTAETAEVKEQTPPKQRKPAGAKASTKAKAAGAKAKTAVTDETALVTVAPPATTAAVEPDLDTMVVTVQQEKLLKALTAAAGAVPPVGKDTLIDRLRLTTDSTNQTLSVAGFNLIIGIAVTMPANVVGTAAWTVSSSRFVQLIQNFPAGAITLTWSPGSCMTVVSKTVGPFEVATRMADDCPTIPLPNEPQRLTLSAQTRWGLGCVLSCAGEEALRCVHMRFWAPTAHAEVTPSLTGAGAVPTAGVTFTAIKQSALLAFFHETPVDTDLEAPDYTVSVAGEVLRKLMGLLNEHPYSVDLDNGSTENVVVRFVVTQGDTTAVFTCRTDLVDPDNLVDGRVLMPGDQDHPVEISLDRSSIVQSLLRQTVFTDKRRAVVLNVLTGEISLSSSGDGIGSGQDTISAHVKGDAIEIKFNPELLLDALRQIASNQVRLSLSDSTAEAYIRDSERDNLFFVLMPTA